MACSMVPFSDSRPARTTELTRTTHWVIVDFIEAKLPSRCVARGAICADTRQRCATRADSRVGNGIANVVEWSAPMCQPYLPSPCKENTPSSLLGGVVGLVARLVPPNGVSDGEDETTTRPVLADESSNAADTNRVGAGATGLVPHSRQCEF